MLEFNPANFNMEKKKRKERRPKKWVNVFGLPLQPVLVVE